MTTTTDIAVHEGGALAVQANQTEWSERQLAVLHSVGIKPDVTEAELTAFLHECQQRRLDPFSKQIYLIGRYDKREQREVYRSQTGIDGFRVIAHRAAAEAREVIGYEETLWCGADGVWRDVWLFDDPPLAAKVVILRNGQRFPGVATLAEYAARYPDGNPMPMWKKMPATMLAKCAESLGLRKAFPDDLSGIYTAEEMQQADNPVNVPPPPAPDPRAHRPQPARPVADEWSTPEPQQAGPVIEDAEVVADGGAQEPEKWQLQRIRILFHGLGVRRDEDVYREVGAFVGRTIDSTKRLSPDEAAQLIKALEARVSAPEPNPVFDVLAQFIAAATTLEDLETAKADIQRDATDGHIGPTELAELQARHRAAYDAIASSASAQVAA